MGTREGVEWISDDLFVAPNEDIPGAYIFYKDVGAAFPLFDTAIGSRRDLIEILEYLDGKGL